MVELNIILGKKGFGSKCTNYDICKEKYGDSDLAECKKLTDSGPCYHDVTFADNILVNGQPLPVCHNDIRFIGSNIPEPDLHWDYKDNKTFLIARKLKIERYVFIGNRLKEKHCNKC